jgi:hypothetical protein
MTRAGKEVFSYNRPQGDIYQARKLRDGQVIFVTSNATVHRIDEKGSEIRSWRYSHPSYQGIHILPNGNVVFPQNNQVLEYNTNGQQVWNVMSNQPMCVHRLPNVNTLIGNGAPFQLIEVDRNGKEVWKVTAPIQPLRVYRR